MDVMSSMFLLLFLFNDPATTEIYTLSLHDALPISSQQDEEWIRELAGQLSRNLHVAAFAFMVRSEEHTSELQSRLHLVCRLLLEKKKNKPNVDTLRWTRVSARLLFLATVKLDSTCA